MRSLKQIVSLLLLAGVPFSYGFASAPFLVKSIKVEGVHRIDVGTVYNDIPLKVGQVIDEDKGATLIRALYRTGFFSDVRLMQQGNTLIVVVVERPAIGSLTITGNKDIKTKDITTALKGIGISEGWTYDPTALERVEQELKRQYYNRGKYNVQVTTTVTQLPRNRVGVKIAISEGVEAKIRRITIIGNKAFSQHALTKDFKLSQGGLFSWFTSDNVYSRDKLNGDLETLRSYYLDRGYLNFKAESTQVSLTPDKKDVYITINIVEGDQYYIKDIDIDGTLIVPKAQLMPLIASKPGSLFSLKEVNDSASAIADKLGDEGYAFTKVNPIPKLDEKTKRVSLTYHIEPGNRMYVRRINFTGNTRTHDQVLRREMTQMEGGVLSSSRIKRSRTNLDRLGFFENINIDTKAVPGTQDMVDVDFKVDETHTGRFSGGLTYSQVDGLGFLLGVNEENFLGSGNQVGFNLNRSKVYSSYAVNYFNPYYTPAGIGRGFRLYYSTTDLEKSQIGADYALDTLGGTLTYEIPISENDKITLGPGLDSNRVKLNRDPATVSKEIRKFLDKNGCKGRNSCTYDTASLNAGWTHDTLNRAKFPTQGFLQAFNVTSTVPGSDLQYYKATSETAWYHPLTDTYTLRLRGSLGYGNAYGKTSELPFFNNFYAGGVGSVRGFDDRSLGPKDSSQDPLGGNFLVTGGAEILFPPPFVDFKAVRTSVFLDAGNVYNLGSDSVNFNTLRYSVGVGVNWDSPVGPLSFNLAKPLNNKPGDDTRVFQFSIGAPF
jgi:outer membrane protein insertion porin family